MTDASSATPQSEIATDETAFLDQLGRRVRERRGQRGMSRKVLARVSGISERYIAQLEGGKGNVSIVLLRRVAIAMGSALEDLLPSDAETADWPFIRDLLRKASPDQIAQARAALAGQPRSLHRRAAGIALIGLRGAGKSTLGRILAERIGWRFVELNKEIERENGLSIAEIIAIYGQDGFRRMEQASLDAVLARPAPIVLATGGGIVSEPLTFEKVLTAFHTVWIKARPEEHMARVRGQGDLRPMADDRSAMAELRTILTSREALYGRAADIVDTAGLSIAEAASRLETCVAPVIARETRAAS